MYPNKVYERSDMNISKTEELNLAVKKAVQRNRGNTIGLLAEKTLHSSLKFYFCDDETCHEIKFKGYVADIFSGSQTPPHIIEIQTKYAYRLAKKLEAYGDDADITVVIPVWLDKKIQWIDPETGDMSTKRSTSKKHNLFHSLCEMYGIKEYLCRKNITVCVLTIKGTEYRLCDGYGKDRKKHATKYDIVPEEIDDEIWLSELSDFDVFRIKELCGEFTSDEFAKCSKMSINDARYAVLTLSKLNIVEECGKKGRKKLWRYKPVEN